MALDLKYGERKIFWGNEGLLVAKLTQQELNQLLKILNWSQGL
jgi:hypothetical protein